jgi:hypothetical protein
MNSPAAANLLENPVALLVLILFGALSSWLMKRRQQRGADASPNAGDLPSARGEQGRSARQLDWQNALRQLLGGEPPPQAPPPLPIARAASDGQTSLVRRDEEQFQTERIWMDEAMEHDEKPGQAGNQAAEHSWQHTALPQASATRIEAHRRQEKAARHVPSFHERATHPARAVSTAHRKHSNGRTVRLWRDPRTVRRAFVASLIFAAPKGLEA